MSSDRQPSEWRNWSIIAFPFLPGSVVAVVLWYFGAHGDLVALGGYLGSFAGAVVSTEYLDR